MNSDRSAAQESSPGESASEPGRAVVLGAGIAGLLAARVLSEHFAEVLLVERDPLDADDPRRGVPQARHLHGLLDRGRTVLEQLYPGFTAELTELGAGTAEALVGTRWYLSGLRAAPTSTGLTSLMATRPVLESVIRRRTLATPGIGWCTGTARGLLGDAGEVTAVLLSDGSGIRPRAADLIVDATGRGSRAPQWLATLGACAPAEERLEVDLGYASALFPCADGQLDGHRSVIISTGAGGRGGGAIRVEGDRWHVTLAGMLGDHPPTDPAGFADFAATLAAPDIHRLITAAEPAGGWGRTARDQHTIVPHKFRAPVRRRFDRLPSVPRGFLVLGDALCSVNPLYAQGMTVAAQQALVLRDCLTAGAGADLPARFYTAASDVVDVAWRLSAGSDLANPGVTGPRTLRTRLTNAYVARAHRAAHLDPVVSRTFLRVANLVEPPAALLRPDLARRILWRRDGGTGPADAPAVAEPTG
ncbi:FAD-dependent oxidoreductase [Nocardia shimofusensis]|uniref:FAD-dependent oxidoreductase n=1 Tax=Nocardia shimofusensis TaxID=228596 RepID=UPI000AA97030|nr:FAD-dependent oxidoreductase [Nocardia shimofusensis]